MKIKFQLKSSESLIYQLPFFTTKQISWELMSDTVAAKLALLEAQRSAFAANLATLENLQDWDPNRIKEIIQFMTLIAGLQSEPPTLLPEEGDGIRFIWYDGRTDKLPVFLTFWRNPSEMSFIIPGVADSLYNMTVLEDNNNKTKQ